MALKEISFKSYNGRDDIKGWIYIPACEPKAIIQVVHGLGEHSRRYLRLIMKFLDAGFVVCADDHAAHGKTALDNNTWGDGGTKGYRTYIEDEHSLRKIVTEDFPNLPFFMHGHSWGSIIAREYSARYGNDMAGVVYCATLTMSENIINLKKASDNLLKESKGNEHIDSLVDILFKNSTERYIEPKMPTAWLAIDEEVVKDHAQDLFNNFVNSPNVYFMNDIANLWIDVNNAEWAAKVPADLPIYIISGDQDPVGNYGQGVYTVANWLWQSGHKNVTTRLYSGYRHEIHNEPAIRDEVAQGLIDFFNSSI